MSKLKQIIREIVNQELDEMARISTLYKIGDAKKANALKMLHKGTWIEDMLDAVEKGGERGITRNDIVASTGKGSVQAVQPTIVKLVSAGVLVPGELEVPKKEKEPSTGIKGRPTSEKTAIAKDVNTKLEADNEYEPTEEELTALGPDLIEKLRLRVKGLLKRGRPIGPSKKQSPPSDINNIEIEDETDVYERQEPLHEQFRRIQKLAGVSYKK